MIIDFSLFLLKICINQIIINQAICVYFIAVFTILPSLSPLYNFPDVLFHTSREKLIFCMKIYPEKETSIHLSQK